MRKCNRCGKEFPVSFFYKGYAHCKTCYQKKTRAYRHTEAGQLARQRERRRAKDNGKNAEWQARYEASPLGIERARRYERKRNSTAAGKARRAAKNAVKYALRTGKLKRLPCEVCGAERAVAHHPSYARDMRLTVSWLCVAHHNELHGQVPA